MMCVHGGGYQSSRRPTWGTWALGHLGTWALGGSHGLPPDTDARDSAAQAPVVGGIAPSQGQAMARRGSLLPAPCRVPTARCSSWRLGTTSRASSSATSSATAGDADRSPARRESPSCTVRPAPCALHDRRVPHEH